MTTKQPFHEYMLSQLRELELTSSTLSQLRDRLGVAYRHRDAANARHSEHDPDRRRAVARRAAYFCADAKAHALFCATEILEHRKDVLSDEVTRAVLVHTLRDTLREVLGRDALSGAEIARRYRDLSDAVTLTRWLRNVDLAREATLWTKRSDFKEPPKLPDDYIDRVLLPGLFSVEKVC